MVFEVMSVVPAPGDEAEDVVRALAGVGGVVVPWERHASGVAERLATWSARGDRNSVLLWTGGGTGGDQLTADLGPESDGAAGVWPAELADHVRNQWTGRTAGRAWAVVAVHAAGASGFVRIVAALLRQRPPVPRRLVMIGADLRPGRFGAAVRDAVASYTDHDADVRLADLLGRIGDRLPDAQVEVFDLSRASLVCTRRQRYRQAVTQARDTEPPSRFVGRSTELDRVLNWLSRTRSGTLIVTGPPGCGRSALLSEVVRRSRVGSGATSGDPLPRDGFDAVILLTGMTIHDVVGRLAVAARASAPRRGDPQGGIDAVLNTIDTRPFTVLVDALDEAAQPAAIAGSVLRRIAALPHGRVVVGTRRTSWDDGPREDLIAALPGGQIVELGPDPPAIARYVSIRLSANSFPAYDKVARIAELVGASGQQFLFAKLVVHELHARPELLLESHAAEWAETIGGNPETMFAMALRRLTATAPASGALLDALAFARGRGLPRADRLWVAAASALSDIPVREADIDHLLATAAPFIMVDADHGQTVYRLSHASFAALLRADVDPDQHARLVRALIAAADPPRLNPYLLRHLPWHVAVTGTWSELLDTPAVLDRLNPHDLAAEIVRTAFGRAGTPAEVNAMIPASRSLAETPPSERSAVRALATRKTGHAVRSGTEPDTAWRPRWVSPPYESFCVVLDGHPDTVTALIAVPLPDGRTVLATGHRDGTVRLWDPLTGTQFGEPLTRGRERITALAMVPVDTAGPVLAARDDNGMVRRWDPVTGTAIGEPYRGHAYDVACVIAESADDAARCLGAAVWLPLHRRKPETTTALPDLPGHTLIATVKDYDLIEQELYINNDATRGNPLVHNQDMINAMATVTLPNGRVLLVTGSDDHTARRWDPITWTAVGNPLTGHTGYVKALAPVPLPDGRTLLATASADHTVRLWDPVTGAAVGRPLVGHTDWVNSVCPIMLADGRTLLASASSDRTVRLWDPLTTPVAHPSISTPEEVEQITSVGRPDGTRTLASASPRGPVRLWDLATGDPMGDPLPVDNPCSLATVTLPDDRVLLAVGTSRGELSLWDTTTSSRIDCWAEPIATRIDDLVALSLPGGRTALVVEQLHSRVRILDVTTGRWTTLFWSIEEGWQRKRSMAALSLPGGRALLAVAMRDGTVWFYKPPRRTPTGRTVEEPSDPSNRTGPLLAAIPLGRRTLLAVAINATMRLWDPVTRDPAGGPMTGHTRHITGITPVRLPSGKNLVATASHDGTVRLWNPRTSSTTHVIRIGTPAHCLHAVGATLAIGTANGILTIDIHGAGTGR